MAVPTSGALRALRALALGCACVGLALGGHLAGGGARPTFVALVAIAVPVGCLSLALTSRRCTLPTIGGAVGASQLALHQAFMWLAAGNGCDVGGGGAMPGHLAGAGSAAIHCQPMLAMSGSVAHQRFSTATMVLGHAAAAVLTTLVLAYGERLAWRLVGWLAPRPVTARRLALASYRSVVLDTAQALVGPARHAGAAGRRGPPARSWARA